MNNLNRSQMRLQLGAVRVCLFLEKVSLYVAVGYPGTLCEPSWSKFTEISPCPYFPSAGIEGTCHHTWCFQVRSVHSCEQRTGCQGLLWVVLFPPQSLRLQKGQHCQVSSANRAPVITGGSQAWTGSLSLTCDCLNPAVTRK